MKRSDTEQVVLDALEDALLESQARGEPAVWVSRYGGYRKSLSARVDQIWRDRFSERRNRPSHRNVEAALRRLVTEGLIESSEGASDVYYRRVAT